MNFSLLEIYVHENNVRYFIDNKEVSKKNIKGKLFDKVIIKETIWSF